MRFLTERAYLWVTPSTTLPDRDLVLVLKADKETRDADGLGMQWLAHYHDLLEAEFALNEGAICWCAATTS